MKRKSYKPLPLPTRWTIYLGRLVASCRRGRAAKAIGVSSPVITRALLGLPIMQGTQAQIREGLLRQVDVMTIELCMDRKDLDDDIAHGHIRNWFKGKKIPLDIHKIIEENLRSY
jgi:hypothetical protein